MAQRNTVFAATCRIVAGVNDGIRVRFGAADQTITLDAGTYWLGLNASNAPADTTLYSPLTSLCDHIEAKLGAGNMQLSANHADQPSFTADRTGHVWWWWPQPGDGVYWGHADTTIAPEWFGVGKASGTYPTKTVASGSTWEDLSDFSSSLLYVVSTDGGVGQHALRDDKMMTRRRTRSAKVDNGAKSTVYFGRDFGARRLRVPLSGIPRSGPDTTYHAARRFYGHQLETGASFILFPDVGQGASVAAWDPDDTGGEGYQYGHQRMTLREGTLGDWDPPNDHAEYMQFWEIEWTADPFVAVT